MVIEESNSTISALRLSEPASGARSLDGAIDGVNSGVVRGNTCSPLHRSTTMQVHRLSGSLILVDEGAVQLDSTDLFDDSSQRRTLVL